MKKHDVALVVPFLAVALAGPSTHAEQAARPQAPIAVKRPHTTEIHGYTLKDDYFWLRDKSNPEVLEASRGGERLHRRGDEADQGAQETLYGEMLGRIKQTDLSVPSRIGEYFYYSRTEEGKQYPYMCRRKGGMEGAEEILLDLNTLAEGHKYLGLGASRCQRRWQLARVFDRHDRLSAVQPAREGSAHRARCWPRTSSGSARSSGPTDNKTLFYTTEDAVSKRSDKFWRHTVGATASDLLYEEKDELFDVGGGALARQEGDLPRELRQDIDRGALPAGGRSGRRVEGRAAARSRPRVRRRSLQRALLHHDQQGREELQGRDRADERPSEKSWKVFIEHNPAVKINGLSFFANHIVVSEREGGLTQLRIIDPKTRQSHRIATDEPDLCPVAWQQPRVRHQTVRFNYQSMVTPSIGLRLRPDDHVSGSS